MDEVQRNSRRRAIWITSGAILVLVASFLAWYLLAPHRDGWMRTQLVRSLEDSTGGRIELGSLKWHLSKLEFVAENLTIHGREAAGETPYAHAERVYLRAKILSFFGASVGLRYLEINRPVVHLIVYPDGTTNQPVPKRKRTGSPVDTLFRYQIDRVEIRDGILLLNDRPLILDLGASDVFAQVGYEYAARRYEGELKLGKVDTVFRNYRPFSSVAELQFSMWPNRALVKSLRLSSGNSVVEASGDLQDFNHPRINWLYKARLDLREAGAIARRRQVRGGVLNVEGQGKWASSEWSSSGKLSVTKLDYEEPSLRLRKVFGGADFSLRPDKLSLPNVFAQLLGGTVTGSAEVTNWGAAAVQGDKAENEQQGKVQVQVRGLRLPDAAAAVSTPRLQLDRLRLAGSVSGTVDVNWQRTPAAAVAELVLDVTPPSTSAPGELPVTVRLRSVYRATGQTLNVSEFQLATGNTSITASGMLGSRTANLKISANTTSLGELTPSLAMLGQKDIPLDVHGRASFDGTLQGKLTAPELVGHLEITDFDLLKRATPVAAASPPIRFHWDSIAVDLQYSPARVALRNGLLKRGAAQVRFDLSATLQEGKFTQESPFALRATVQNTQLADVMTLLGRDEPLTGLLNADVDVRGVSRDLQGNATLRLTGASVHGEGVQRASADIVFAGPEARFSNISLAKNGGQVTGSATYNLTSGAIGFDLRGSNFNLAQLSITKRPGIALAGLLDFAASGSGTKDAPTINLNANLRQLSVNGEAVGGLKVQATTHGEDMHLSAHSMHGYSDFSLDGNIRLREDFPGKLELKITRLDLDPLLRAFLNARLTENSQLAGNITASGPWRRPRDLTIYGNIERLVGGFQGVTVQNQGPVKFSMARRVARLEQLHLVAEDTNMTASGTVNLDGSRAMNLRADGRLNLKLIQSLNADYFSAGTLTMNVQVGGTVAKPSLLGQVDIRRGAISYIDLPSGLSNINGTLVFDQDRLQVHTLSARTGGGTLDIGGFVTYADRSMRFNLEARGKEIRVRYPPGVSGIADVDLRLQGATANSTLSGEVTITRFGLNPQFNFANYLAQRKQPTEAVDPKSPLNDLHLDVRVLSTPELQVQTTIAKLSGEADLRVRGTAARPVVLGRINIVEGQIVFNGTKYQLERGDILFANPATTQPVLDIEATTRVQQYDIALGLHGPTDKLTTNYRSDPPLATEDIIALLAFGRTRAESAQQTATNAAFTETASNAILSQALNAAVSSRVQRLFGVGRIKIDPQIGSAENNPSGARLTIEQQVSNKLTITYITDVSGRSYSNQQVIQAEYNVTPNLSIVAVRDQYGVVGFDVRIRQRKK